MKKRIFIFIKKIFIIVVIIFFLIFIFKNIEEKYNDILNKEKEKITDEISSLKIKIINFFYSDLKNEYAKNIDNICEKENNFEVCLVKKIIDDFEKKNNYFVLKKGIIYFYPKIKGFNFAKDKLKFTNLIFKNKLIFDEYCTENKSIFTERINIVKRSVFNDKEKIISKFSSDNCHSFEKWQKKGSVEQNIYEEKTGYLPGKILLYDFDKIKTKTVSADENFLNIKFEMDVINGMQKYKKYLIFVSEGKVNEKTTFNKVEINFKINIKDYKINEVNIVDNFYVPATLIGADVKNIVKINFFYDTKIELDEINKKLNYLDINCADCNNFNFDLD